MALDNNTQEPVLGANPNNGATQPQSNEGNPQPTQPQVEPKNEGKTYSQKELDDTAALARGSAERETKKKLLAQLGLKADEEDKLLAFKEAYQNSLSDEEKRAGELANLQAENLKLSQDLEEKEYVVKALIEMTGKKEEDVDKIVKMAKGLKTEDNSIEDAIKEVISMISIDKPSTEPTQPNPDMPTGENLIQPSSTVVIDNTENPFKAGQINLTKQGKLIKENPELAKKLAGEAGVNLKI